MSRHEVIAVGEKGKAVELFDDRLEMQLCMHMKAARKILLSVTNFYVNGIVVKDSNKAFLGKFTSSRSKG